MVLAVFLTCLSWAIDLGSGSYSLRGYWTKSSKDGARYSYYRKSTRGHNTLTFGGFDGHPGPSNQLGEWCSTYLKPACTSCFGLLPVYHWCVLTAKRVVTACSGWTGDHNQRV